MAALVASLVLFGFVVLNVVARNHARAMSVFAADGERTAPPEALRGLAKLAVLVKGVNLPRPCNGVTPDDVGRPCTTHTIPVGDGEHLEAWLMTHPAPRGVVVLFHGYGSCKSSLVAEGVAVHGMGYTAFLVDFRGSGGSSGNSTTLGVHEALDVRAADRYVREHVDPVLPIILYGKSMGAVAITRAVAVEDVQPAAVILEAVFDSMLNTVRNRFRSMRVPAFPSAELLVFWGGRRFGESGFRHNPVDYARAIRQPALMLHGEDDPRAELQQARRVYDRLSGPKRFVTFPGVGHQSCVNAGPQLWREAVETFLHGLR